MLIGMRMQALFRQHRQKQKRVAEVGELADSPQPEIFNEDSQSTNGMLATILYRQ